MSVVSGASASTTYCMKNVITSNDDLMMTASQAGDAFTAAVDHHKAPLDII
ncbi:MAG: hypothetical protein ABUS47_02240 [Steroidobacter sp.]|jgi:hypothetical protein